MFYLTSSLGAWNSDSFNNVIKKEVCSLDSNLLPLQQGLTYSSFAIGDNLSATILHSEEVSGQVLVKAGLFYTGIIAGCNCADDPTPVDENTEYCEVLFSIDIKTAQTSVSLLD